MAVFEKRKDDKIKIDDTMSFTFEIASTEYLKDHIEYSIKVSRLPELDKPWIVNHRYSDFRSLHSLLKTPTIKLPHFPPKKYFGNKDKDFISERRTLLQDYLDQLVKIPFVSTSPYFKRFMDPQNSSGKFLEDAHEHILESLRSGGRHTVTQAVPCMGTRLRKHHFIGHPLANPKTACSFWFAPYGPDRALSVKEVHSAATALVNCQHPYIAAPITCIATEAGFCAVRHWFRQGSLRDYIYCVKPQFHFLLKYSNDRQRNMSIDMCAVYGRQILEALSFLHERGIAHGALHSGNVVIENNVCQLMDIENQIVGLPHPLRPFFVSLKKVNSMETIDVYSFGHLLYEMVFNAPLMKEVCSTLSSDLDPLCRSVLESILSAEACRNGLPSVSDLLTHAFFNKVPLHSYEKPNLRITAAVKASFSTSFDALLTRLKEDQRKTKLLRQKMRGEEAVAHQPKNKVTGLPQVKTNIKPPQIETNSINGAMSEVKEVESTAETLNQLTDDESNGSAIKETKDAASATPPDGRDEFLSSIANFQRSNLRRSLPKEL